MLRISEFLRSCRSSCSRGNQHPACQARPVFYMSGAINALLTKNGAAVPRTSDNQRDTRMVRVALIFFVA